MTNKRIINFDTIYSTKNTDSNPFNTTFQLSETLKNISKITLNSIEIPISNYNIRSPYCTISLKYNNAFFYYTLTSKTFVIHLLMYLNLLKTVLYHYTFYLLKYKKKKHYYI